MRVRSSSAAAGRVSALPLLGAASRGRGPVPRSRALSCPLLCLNLPGLPLKPPKPSQRKTRTESAATGGSYRTRAGCVAARSSPELDSPTERAQPPQTSWEKGQTRLSAPAVRLEPGARFPAEEARNLCGRARAPSALRLC